MKPSVRLGEDGIGHDAPRGARAVFQEERLEDAEIVIGGVGELRPAPDVASREDPEGLGQFQRDGAATQEEQMSRTLAEIDPAPAVDQGHLVQPWQIRSRRAGARVEHQPVGQDHRLPHAEAEAAPLAAFDPGLTPQQAWRPGLAEALLQLAALFRHQGTGAVHHRGEIHLHRGDRHAPFGRVPGLGGQPGGSDHRLAGRAAEIDAGAAEGITLDQQDIPARRGQGAGQGHTSLPGPDDHGLCALHGHGWLFLPCTRCRKDRPGGGLREAPAYRQPASTRSRSDGKGNWRARKDSNL